jgi:outer membrane protein assembly factor BamB
MPRLVSAVAFALSLAPPILAADWPEFRGPDGAGRYDGPPLVTKWGPDTNVAWKTEIPGRGWSSPIYVNGKIFLTTAVPLSAGARPDQSLRALCVDPQTGKILWDTEVFVEPGSSPSQPHTKNTHASPTPVSDGERVYVHFGHQGTACLDFAGNIVWKTREHAYKPVHGNGGSPILVEDKLVYSADGGDVQFVIALDAKTGAVRWKTPRNLSGGFKFSFSTPTLVESHGRKVIVSPASNWVAAYDPADGKEVWRVKYPVTGYSVIPRPVVVNGLIVVSTGYTTPNLIAFAPPAAGATTAPLAWSIRRDAPNTPTPVVVGTELYAISDKGMMSCIDAQSGVVHWSERLRGTGYSASPIVANGLIYVTSEEGIGQVVKATTEGFEEVAASDLRERTFATFAPVNGALFVRTESMLYRFEK